MPLIFNFIVFLLGYICEENMLYIKEYVNVFEGENIHKVKMQFKDIPTIEEEDPIEANNENLAWLIKRWEIISTIYHQFPLFMYNLNNKYKDYIRLFTYSGYFIGWSYYLFILFYPLYNIKFHLSFVFIIIFLYMIVISYIIIYQFKSKPLNNNDNFSRNKEILNEYLILGKFNIFCIKYNIYIIILGVTLYVFVLLKGINVFICSCLLYYIYLLFISLFNILINKVNNNKYILILLRVKQYIIKNMTNLYDALYEKVMIKPFVIKQGNYLISIYNINYKNLYFLVVIPHILVLFFLLFLC